MKRFMQIGFVAATLLSLMVAGATAQDPISEWNAITEQAVKTAGHAPPVAALDFAIVHLAIYDSVESIDRRYEPDHLSVPGATGSLSAAAAKAGHDVVMTPGDWIDSDCTVVTLLLSSSPPLSTASYWIVSAASPPTNLPPLWR